MKKAVRIGIVCILLAFSLCNAAIADGGSALIRSEGASVKAGAVAEIAVTVENNPGLAAWMLELRWDEAIFSVAGDQDAVQPGEKYVNGAMLSKTDEPGQLSVNWYNVKNVAEDGVLFTVPFLAAEDAETGDYEIELICSEKNTINYDEELVPVRIEPIKVHIEGIAPIPTEAQETPTKPADQKIEGMDKGIELDVNSTVIGKDEQKQLTVTNSENNEKYIWKSDNEAVVKVEDGRLIPQSPGSAMITVTNENGTKESACAVTVTEETAAEREAAEQAPSEQPTETSEAKSKTPLAIPIIIAIIAAAVVIFFILSRKKRGTHRHEK